MVSAYYSDVKRIEVSFAIETFGVYENSKTEHLGRQNEGSTYIIPVGQLSAVDVIGQLSKDASSLPSGTNKDTAHHGPAHSRLVVSGSVVHPGVLLGDLDHLVGLHALLASLLVQGGSAQVAHIETLREASVPKLVANLHSGKCTSRLTSPNANVKQQPRHT